MTYPKKETLYIGTTIDGRPVTMEKEHEITLEVIYKDDSREEIYADDYGIECGCLCIYIREGKYRGKRHIPMSGIKEFTIK